jgi:hypothetical protein
MTSCNTSLSSVRSATALRRRTFSSSNCRSFCATEGIKAAYKLLPAKERRLQDAHLAAHFADLRAALRLPAERCASVLRLFFNKLAGGWFRRGAPWAETDRQANI